MAVLKGDKEKHKEITKGEFPPLAIIAGLNRYSLSARHIGFLHRTSTLGFLHVQISAFRKRKQMRLSPVWNIKCFRGGLQLSEVILLERAFKYFVLERIRLGGEMKLKLRTVIKSQRTLPF